MQYFIYILFIKFYIIINYSINLEISALPSPYTMTYEGLQRGINNKEFQKYIQSHTNESEQFFIQAQNLINIYRDPITEIQMQNFSNLLYSITQKYHVTFTIQDLINVLNRIECKQFFNQLQISPLPLKLEQILILKYNELQLNIQLLDEIEIFIQDYYFHKTFYLQILGYDCYSNMLLCAFNRTKNCLLLTKSCMLSRISPNNLMN